MEKTEGRRLLDAGKIREAIRFFTLALEDTDKLVQANAALELALIYEVKWKKSVFLRRRYRRKYRDFLLLAVSLEQRFPRADFEYAVFCSQREDFTEAVRFVERAVCSLDQILSDFEGKGEGDSDEYWGLFLRKLDYCLRYAVWLANIGRFDDAIREFLSVIDSWHAEHEISDEEMGLRRQAINIVLQLYMLKHDYDGMIGFIDSGLPKSVLFSDYDFRKRLFDLRVAIGSLRKMLPGPIHDDRLAVFLRWAYCEVQTRESLSDLKSLRVLLYEKFSSEGFATSITDIGNEILDRLSEFATQTERNIHLLGNRSQPKDDVAEVDDEVIRNTENKSLREAMESRNKVLRDSKRRRHNLRLSRRTFVENAREAYRCIKRDVREFSMEGFRLPFWMRLRFRWVGSRQILLKVFLGVFLLGSLFSFWLKEHVEGLVGTTVFGVLIFFIQSKIVDPRIDSITTKTYRGLILRLIHCMSGSIFAKQESLNEALAQIRFDADGEGGSTSSDCQNKED